MYTYNDIEITQQTITGLNTRIAQLGKGQTVLFLHGWPECWYSWRSQLIALANAGYHAVAPDMPGFAGTQARPRIEDYHIENTSEFILGVIESITDAKKPIILVSHDWGATNAWQFVLRHPDAVSQLVTMSVPLRPISEEPPVQVFKKRFVNRFFYQLYFQQPGIAEAEFEADPRSILSRLYASPETPREPAKLVNAPPEQGGWIDRLGNPKEQAEWLEQADLDYFVEVFTQSSFAGGINYYRNIDKNWELMAPYAERKVECPVLFLAGSKDNTLMNMNEQQLKDMMEPRVTNLKIKLY
ncbi:MAG: alpha/beta hydrolase, partial [Spongiibacteraceae bacterium]|nr:alpha/beta hydrolase [Spongiibacteraceae bacterium]